MKRLILLIIFVTFIMIGNRNHLTAAEIFDLGKKNNNCNRRKW